MNTAASDARSKYLVLQFSYTTAQIAERRFCSETPNPLYFVTPQPPVEVYPITLTVVDGEPCLVRNEPPPDARPPNYNSRLFELANVPAVNE